MKFPQRKPFLSHRFHILCLHLLLISVKIDYKLKECIKGTLTVRLSYGQRKKNLLKNEVPTKEAVSLSSFPYPLPTFASHQCEN